MQYSDFTNTIQHAETVQFIRQHLSANSIDQIVTDPPYFLIDGNGKGLTHAYWESVSRKRGLQILQQSRIFSQFIERLLSLSKTTVTIEQTLIPDVESIAISRPIIDRICQEFGIPPIDSEFILIPLSVIKNIAKEYNIDTKSDNYPASFAMLTKKSNIVGKIEAYNNPLTGMFERNVLYGNYANVIELQTDDDYENVIWLLYFIFFLKRMLNTQNTQCNLFPRMTMFYDLIYLFHRNWLEEAYRVLKPGSWIFISSTPRSDSFRQLITALQDTGFLTRFPMMYWAYPRAYPHAENVAFGIENRFYADAGFKRDPHQKTKPEGAPDIPPDIQAEIDRFQGAYAGYTPRTAVEPILVAMKPCDEATFTLQARKNGKAITWLEEGRIPYADIDDRRAALGKYKRGVGGCQSKILTQLNNRDPSEPYQASVKGRFSPQLLVSDMTLGSFSKYFDLSLWFNERLKKLPKEVQQAFPILPASKPTSKERSIEADTDNDHISVKPIEIIKYLIILGSEKGDIILDPFGGSGTTAFAAFMCHRTFILIEGDPGHFKYADHRIKALLSQLKMTGFIKKSK